MPKMTTVTKQRAKSRAKPARKSAAKPAAEPVAVTQTNAGLLARREASVPRGVASAAPIFAAKAENAELWDVEGKRYIDFAAKHGFDGVGFRMLKPCT